MLPLTLHLCHWGLRISPIDICNSAQLQKFGRNYYFKSYGQASFEKSIPIAIGTNSTNARTLAAIFQTTDSNQD
jgi:hypothetical protein